VGRVLGVELRGFREFPEFFPILSPLRQLVFFGVPPDDGVLGAAQGFVILVPPAFGVVFPAILGNLFAPLLPDAAESLLGLGDALPGLFLVLGVPLQIFLHGALLVRDPGPAVVELLELPLAPGEVVVGGVGGRELAPGEGVFPGAAQGAGFSVPQLFPLVLQGLDAQEQVPLDLQKFGLPGQRFQTRFGALPIFLQGALAVGEFLGALPGVFQQEPVFFPELEGLDALVEEGAAFPQALQTLPPFSQRMPLEEILQGFSPPGHGVLQGGEGLLPLLKELVPALALGDGGGVEVFRLPHFLVLAGALAREVLKGV